MLVPFQRRMHTMGLLERLAHCGVILALTVILISSPASAQTFISGSTGADGTLDFSGVPAGTTILFDPDAFDPPLDPEHDNVYHFTMITIPAGVTVRLSAEVLGVKPVVWLATGAVLIDRGSSPPFGTIGTIDLSGEDGSTAAPIPAKAGAGGFRGGIRRTSNLAAQPGDGPGGGRVTSGSGGGAGHAVVGDNGSAVGSGGAAYGNDFLLPLLGGSGGAGGAGVFSETCGGGAGGGALLIASSVSITIIGAIKANGGSGAGSNFFCFLGGSRSSGGAGSGGAIRLMAPIISGQGSISAGGGGGGTRGSDGRIRLEAFQHNFIGGVSPAPHFATPGIVFLPASAPSVRVVRVAGVDVPENPTGSFTMPDVAVDNVAAVVVEIEAQNVPVGTVVQLSIFSETGPRQMVESTPLEGTEALSNATAVVTLPHGFSRFSVQANWVP